MITRGLLVIPPPEDFWDAKPGAVMMFFLNTGRTGDPLDDMVGFRVQCDRFVFTEPGISIHGKILEPRGSEVCPTAIIDQLVLIDIDWDTGRRYNGQIVIAGCYDEHIADW